MGEEVIEGCSDFRQGHCTLDLPSLGGIAGVAIMRMKGPGSEGGEAGLSSSSTLDRHMTVCRGQPSHPPPPPPRTLKVNLTSALC